MIPNALVAMAVLAVAGTPPYKCGEKRTIRRAYGPVERSVDCGLWKEGTVIVSETLGKERHGTTLILDTNWRLRDSSFYAKGKKEGRSVRRDSLGNLHGFSCFENGIPVGAAEEYHAPGVLASMKSFDSAGNEHGSTLEWWPNGTMRKDLTFDHGVLQRWLDFYPTGKPRLLYTAQYGNRKDGTAGRMIASMQTWAPDGRPTGMVRDGSGEALLFLLDGGKDPAVLGVLRETYRDGEVQGTETLDTAKAYRRLDSLDRAAKAAGKP
jgi:hypothetical protein